MRRWHRSFVAFVSIAIGCRSPAPVAPPAPGPLAGGPPSAAPAAPAARAIVALASDAGERGTLELRLVDPAAAATRVTATPIASAELAPLLAQLEPLPASAPPPPLVRPPSAAPAPAAAPTPLALAGARGTAIADLAPGPPPPPPPAAAAPIEPLAAPELLPTGEVAAATEVHVRFAQPMVPVAEVGVAPHVPATITPAIPGSWRWLDTRVAKFTAATRFPSATTFAIHVPAGTRALAGGTLAKDTLATFSTPPISLASVGPQPARPDSALVLAFDQPLDPAALAPFLRIEHAGKRLAFELATRERAEELWRRDPRLAKPTLPAHAVFVEPVTAWPAGAELQVVLAAGAPSLEGPRRTTKELRRGIAIAKPFTLRGLACGGAPAVSARCPAGSVIGVALSNPIETWQPPQLTLDGNVADPEGRGTSIQLVAPTTVGTRHAVALAADLVDAYGQPLTGPRAASFVTTPTIYDWYLEAQRGLFVLDPRFEIPQWKVEGAALAAMRVQLYRVTPADYFAYRAYELGDRKQPPGTLVHDQPYAIGPRHAGIARVDLRPALTAGLGHVIGVATPLGGRAAGARPITAWIQVTKLGVVARLDRERVHAWATRIEPASALAPVAGARTELVVEGVADRLEVTADAEGHATLELPAAPDRSQRRRTQALLVTSSGGDAVFEAIDHHERSVRRNDARWYVTDDRFTYKPNEPVYLKGWVRWTHDGVNPDLALPARGDTVAWTLHDARGAKLATGSVPLTSQGGFDVEVALPDTANLGTATFTFEARGDTYTWPIAIEEFRTPTFAVALDDDVTHRGATPLYAGEAIELAATAKYYSGGGLAGARVRWDATLRAAAYAPPGHDDFTFAPRSRDSYYRAQTSAGTRGLLSGTSSSSVAVEIAAVPEGAPSLLQVEATVTDLDRATIRESSRPVLVHPSAYYVGIREHAKELQLIVTDVEGQAVPGVAIEVAIEGVAAAQRWDTQPLVVDRQACKLTSTRAPVACAWQPRDEKTTYRVHARVVDGRGRANQAYFAVPWWHREPTTVDLAVTTDKAQYRPGDVAKLAIHSAVTPATAIVTIARQGVIAQRRLTLAQPVTTYELPIEAGFLRNVHVQVDRVAGRGKSRLPGRVTAETEVALDPEHGRLAVTTRPLRPTVGPGEQATFEVAVHHRGKPVAGAEVALLAVDEAVLAVSDKRHKDPLAPFYFDVAAGTTPWTTLDQIVDAGDEVGKPPGFERHALEGAGSGYGVGAGRGMLGSRSVAVPSVRVGAASVQTRRDFRATAVWSPRLVTDATGRTRVTVKMPDSLTRFRIVALATADTRYFGKAESTIATQRPLNVRASAPRFLSVGDRFSLSVVVQNLDRTPRVIDVGVRTANLVERGPMGQRVTIPAGQRAELRFELAASARGRAIIQTVARAGELVDASQLELPIYVPATTEAFATYGIVDGDRPAFEGLVVPADVVPEIGGVETELFASQLSSLLDAYWYLQEYPFECAEQRSSRVLANAALAEVFDGFGAPGRPSAGELAAQRARDIHELARTRRPGGWGYFAGTQVDPFVTQQVVAALIASGAKGPQVEAALGELAKANLARIARLEQLAVTPVPPPSTLTRERAELSGTVALAASELATLALAKRAPTALVLRLHAVASRLARYPLDAKARVLGLLAGQPAAAAARRELRAQLLAAVHEDASTAAIAVAYGPDERALLVSEPKTTALVLDALIREAPTHGLIPKLARGLLDRRKRGRWTSTQENLAVLQAMRRYFDTYEQTAPDFTGKLWVGTAGYAEHGFATRAARAAVHVPWSALPGKEHTLAIAKTGPGRMYYRVGIQYAPAHLDPTAIDAGMIVRRSYRAADHPADVTRTPDGNYRVKLGARVEVTLEVVATSPRHAVALVDPLPAGFEPINTRLATAEAATQDLHAWDHVNLRDNRSEAFAMAFPAGSRRFVYTVRATTAGVFAAAPAKAEEMYAPETFGRTGGATVTIE